MPLFHPAPSRLANPSESPLPDIPTYALIDAELRHELSPGEGGERENNDTLRQKGLLPWLGSTV